MKRILALLMACLTSGMLLANHWTPEAAGYSGVMAVYGVVQIDGIEQYSDQLEIGAFCGDECRGSAIANEFFLTHRYLAIINVFGENGHQITFKLYDHSTGQEFESASQEAITFIEDGYGNPIEPYVLSFIGASDEAIQTIQLSQGWNWFSPNVEITLDDLKAALVAALPGATNIRISSKDANITYNGTRWRGTLNTLDVTRMYMIEVPNDCEITLEGLPLNPAELPITIVPGMNWISFPLNASMSISEAFSGFAVSGDKVSSKNQSATYTGTRWRGTLTTLEPGQGYMYESSVQGTRSFVFPVGTK